MIALIEGFVGVGVAIGPMMGMYTERYVGFSSTCLIFGGIMGPLVLLALWLPRPGSEDTTEVMNSQGDKE